MAPHSTRLTNPDRYYAKLPVWEVRLRLWHWMNALVLLLLILSYLLFDWHKTLGLTKPTTELFQKIHVYLGYLFTFLVLARLHLAFHGNTFSRWKDLDPRHQGRGPAEVLKQEIGIHLHPPVGPDGLPVPDPDPGHNRLGRFIYLPLLVVILPLQVITGLLWASFKWGFLPIPALHRLSPAVSKPVVWALSNIHAAGLYAILGFFFLHLGGLIKYELTFSSDLFSSMVHGKKILTREAAHHYQRQTGEKIE